MYLSLTGDRDDVRLGISDTGSWHLFGEAKHEFSSTHNSAEHEVISTVRNALMAWSIYPSDAEEIDIDGTSLGLFQRVKQEPSKPHGMLVYFADNPHLLGVTVALPPDTFSKVKELLEHVLLSSGLEFRLTLSFIGIRVPESESEAPTSAEFLAGVPLFFDEVAIIVSNRSADA